MTTNGKRHSGRPRTNATLTLHGSLVICRGQECQGARVTEVSRGYTRLELDNGEVLTLLHFDNVRRAHTNDLTS